MAAFGKLLFSCILTGLLAAPLATTAHAKMSKAEKVALDEAVHSCKAEARGKKVKWLARRKYVNSCVGERLKDHPNMDVGRLLKDHPEMKGLAKEQWDAF